MQQLTPWIQSRFYYKNSTLPLSMGFLTFYYTGTTNKAPTFQEKNGALNPNPIPLDIVGEAQIWLSDGIVYDVEIRDANNALQDTRLGVSASSEGGGGGGLDFVTTANSETITLDGLGTQPNPLTATLNISSVTSNALSITTAGGGGVYVADMSEAIANKLDKVDATAQSVTSSVDFNNGIRVIDGYLGAGSPQVFLGSDNKTYIIRDGDALKLNTTSTSGNEVSNASLLNDGFSLQTEESTTEQAVYVNSSIFANTFSSVGMGVTRSTVGLESEASVLFVNGDNVESAKVDFVLSNLNSGGVDAFNFTGAKAIFNSGVETTELLNVPTDTLAYTYGENASGDLAKSLGGGGGSQDLQSVTDLGNTTTNGATFEGVVNADKGIVANTNDSDQYPLKLEQSPLASAVHFSSKGNGYQTWVGLRGNGTRRSTLGTTPNGSGTQWKLELYDSSGLNPISVFDVRYDRNLTINKDLEVPRLLQGSVTDDNTTGIQCEDFRSDGSLGSIVIGQSPSSSSKTGNSIKYTRDGANYLTYGLGGLSASLRIGSSSSLTNVLFTSNLNSTFFGNLSTVGRILQGSVTDDGTTGIQCEELRVEGDVVLDAIPTGTQVGLVGYDSNGKLIQGVGGGGGVTPTAWVNASLNSSLGVRSSMRPLRYRGDGIDGVQIEGSCRYNTGLALFPGFSVVLFTLPIGSRPNKDVNLTVQVGFNGAVPQIEAWASLNSTNGQVTLKNSDSVAISQLYDITINTRFSLI